MGYFPNGSAGMDYEQAYCSRCIHQNGPDGKSGCAVWMAHLIRNYDECNNDESILHMLIPLSKDGLGNERCRMFWSVAHKGGGEPEPVGELSEADKKYLDWQHERRMGKHTFEPKKDKKAA